MLPKYGSSVFFQFVSFSISGQFWTPRRKFCSDNDGAVSDTDADKIEALNVELVDATCSVLKGTFIILLKLVRNSPISLDIFREANIFSFI